MHTAFTPAAYPEPDRPRLRTQQVQPNQTPLIVWKVHVAHDREHGYHDSVHSAEVAQLYPQIGDFIAS
jgi:hypothetical protein